MKPNFYQKLNLTNDENEKKLLDNISKVLDNSIKNYIDNKFEEETIQKLPSINDKRGSNLSIYLNSDEFREIMFNNPEDIYNNDFNELNQARRLRTSSRLSRLRNMINNLEEQSENLNQIIENGFEVVG